MVNGNQSTFNDAIREALFEEMERDPSVILIGQEVGISGGRRGTSKGLWERFGPTRVIDTPLSEDLYAGIAIGAAEGGLRPVVEFMCGNFLLIALTDIYRASIWRAKNAQKISIPIVIRAIFGGYDGWGAELSASFVSVFAQIPKLTIIAPSESQTAKESLKAAIRLNDPVLFLEHKKLYPLRNIGSGTDEIFELGKARVIRQGKDILVVTYAYMTVLMDQASKLLEVEGISIEIIDLNILQPYDIETILLSAQRLKRVLIVEEDIKGATIGAGIGMRIHEYIPDAKIKTIGAKPIPIPFGSAERFVLPSVSEIVEAARYLKNKN